MSAGEWFPEVGERVVSVRNDRSHRSVTPRVVNRIGKRDIVLDDGSRYRVRDLSRDGGGEWNRWTVVLMQPDAPYVVQLRAEIRRANERRAAEEACSKFSTDRGRTPGLAADTILVLAPLTGVEDEIRALFESPASPAPRSETPTERTGRSEPSESRGSAAGGGS